MEDFSLTKDDGQSKQLCSLSKLGDNVLKITLCVGHECTIISEDGVKNQPLDCLGFVTQVTQVKEGSIMSVLQVHVHALVKSFNA